MSLSRPALPLPALVAHADWSLHDKGRWFASAALGSDGRYRAAVPEPVGPLGTYFQRLSARAGDKATIFLGFDFPFGLPRRFAEEAGFESFLAFLEDLAAGSWPNFFEVAEEPGEVSPRRPFYPRRNKAKGEIKQEQLLKGLGLASREELYRACDHATAHRTAASPLFWTLGAQQVGKATIAGWRDLLLPGLAAGLPVKIWPFGGSLPGLLAEPGIVIAETYPGEVYHHLGIAWKQGGKRSQTARESNASALLETAAKLRLDLGPNYRSTIEEGFGPAPSGEDPFDATVGLLGMLNVLRGNRPPGDPEDETVEKIEGWILGQTAAP